MNKWFVNINNHVKGPYTPDQLQQEIKILGDDLQTTFVWSRGHSEWIRADKWTKDSQTNFDKKTYATTTVTAAAAVKTIEKTPEKMIENIKESSVEKFRVQFNFIDKGEMTKDELSRFAAQQEDVSKISIYDKKDKLWKEIYTLTDVCKKLGITRRKNQRVPILAQFSGIETRSQNPINARVITISQGGIGITENYDLKLGEIIQGQLTSPHFFSPLAIHAEVTYTGLDGYVGLKFLRLNDEASALIADYIKRFGKDQDEL